MVENSHALTAIVAAGRMKRTLRRVSPSPHKWDMPEANPFLTLPTQLSWPTASSLVLPISRHPFMVPAYSACHRTPGLKFACWTRRLEFRRISQQNSLVIWFYWAQKATVSSPSLCEIQGSRDLNFAGEEWILHGVYAGSLPGVWKRFSCCLVTRA